MIKNSDLKWNCWGATSFWVSTSVWESLLNAKKLHFSSCSCVSLMWVSRAYDEKSTFLVILSVFIVFDHVNACASLRLLVEIHNKSRNHSNTFCLLSKCHSIQRLNYFWMTPINFCCYRRIKPDSMVWQFWVTSSVSSRLGCTSWPSTSSWRSCSRFSRPKMTSSSWWTHC